MIVKFTAEGIRDFGYWEATNPRLVSKINALISSVEAAPFKGLG